MSKNIGAAARGQGKLQRRLLTALVAGCFGSAAANPVGPQVINGQASFSTQGNVLSVTNTPGAIINWQGFSINAGELTRFIQQNAGSAVLNRVTGGDPSQILGALQSNGRVFLVNPNGILFGQGAQVDVNGLVASTLNIGNDDFIKGKWNFQAGDKAGSLKNQGAITTPAGGQVVLIAPNVENSGIITSPRGDVMLAAGRSVQLVDTMNPDLQVVISAPEDEAVNLGKVIAQGGKTGIYGALVKQRGFINADSAVVGENGKVVLKASRDTLLEAGSVTSATGAGKGGELRVLGERVALTGDAKVDVSGQLGGGTVLIGGDYQGKSAEVPNAAMSHVSAAATIKADAIENGDGGKVVVWADDTTRVYGKISVRGGTGSGNGGFVETSAHHHLDVIQAPDVSAPMGQGGNWLLDPENITIATADSNIDPAGLPDTFKPHNPGSSTVNATAIKTAIDGGATVTIDTSIAGGTGDGNIVIDSSAATALGGLNALSGAKLILNAHNDITIKSNIINTGDALAMVFKANAYGTASTGKVSLDPGVQLQPKNGPVTISSKGDITLATGAIIGNKTVDYDDFILTSTAGGISLNGAAILTNGDVTLKAGGTSGISTSGTGAGAGGLFVQGANVALDSAGLIKIDKFDGTVVARSTGTGSSITLTDAGGLVVGSSSISSVPAGIIADGDITLNASGRLRVNGPVSAGPGNIVMNTTTLYGVIADADISGRNVHLNGGDEGVVGSGTITASNLYLQSTGGTGPIGDLNSPLYTSSPGGTGNTNISIGGSSTGPSAVYIEHTGDATLTQAILKAATPVPLVIAASGNLTTSAAIVTGGGSIDLASSHGKIQIEGGLNSSAAAPGDIYVEADSDIYIKGDVAANGSPNGGSVSLISNNGSIAFVSPNGAVSATGANGMVSIDASYGSITSDSSASTAITASQVILTAGSGIHGPTSSSQLAINASKLDITNYDDGAVRIKNTGSGLILADLDEAAETYAVYHGSTGDVQITDGTSLTVGDKISAPVATLILDSPAITIQNDVSAHGIQFYTDSLPAFATGIVESTGMPTPTSFGGVFFSPKTSGKSIKIGAGAGPATSLLIDPAKLKTSSDTPAAGDIVSDAFSFRVDSNAEINVNAAMSLPDATVYTQGGTINVNAAVNAESVAYIANSFSAGAVTTANTSYGSINIGPYDTARKMLIAPGATDPSNGSDLWINSAYLSSKFIGNTLSFGTYGSGGAGAANTDITISASISGSATTFKNLEFLSKGTVKQSTASDVITLPSIHDATPCSGCGALRLKGGSTSGGVFELNVADNSVDYISAYGNTIKFKNAKSLGAHIIEATGGVIDIAVAGGFSSYYDIYSAGGAINIQADGDFISYDAINSKGGDVTIKTTGGSHDIFIDKPGIDACHSVTSCSSTVKLDATGSINIPLVRAGLAVDLKAGGNVVDGDSSLNNIEKGDSSRQVTLTYNVTGNIDLDAHGAKPGTGSTAGSNSIRWSAPTSSGGGGGGGTVTPTLDQCVANPSTSGCSSVLPSLNSCVANPAQAGCSAVLPSVDACVSNPAQTGCSSVLPTLDSCVANPAQSGCSVVLPKLETCVSNPAQSGCSSVLPKLESCVSNPTQTGCSVVLPMLDSCVSNPTQTGCSVVLPKLDTCVSNPAQAGCTAVLPKLDSCMTNPAQTGCSAVLPKLDACVTNPAQIGCSVVLPKLDSCVSNPAQAGCSAVLPKIDACVVNPAQTGCSVVLPKFDSCVANPAQAGCTVVLPTMDTCTSAPGTAGCTAVLPTLNQCSSNPNLEGCSAVLPLATQCTLNPKTAGCETVLPSTGTGTGNNPGSDSGTKDTVIETVSDTVTTTVNTVVKSANQASAMKPESGSGTSSGGAGGSGLPPENSSDKGDEKKDEKKTTSGTDDSGAKKNETAKKMYCN
ncbi:MAG TPA: filamentous hemagglutinin N-terminal domain-containing protein [Noviherbaspirillum sp.]|uniref:two-partner secretion domain-containing protein n=1 Tax=Noviherbaspirillum sp. TaxID=1926288 RepID=UPI002D75E2C4|nr:filamentous hemagglutinin N-terminal domain-containing protein [Noviherbaspirillum sp.]HYD94083.1 filamentous hemagglutinin N-terminal domain-containing protein [Noviherbaspirillum sp.]